MFKRLSAEISAIKARDPAARSTLSIFLTYPGLHAVLVYRLAHWLWQRRINTPALILAYMARIVTGIEIHPAARIGERFFIDHGTGVVIGETAEIGNDVMLYHGVTLGGTTLDHGKRHPTLRDGVIVGAGAKVLGPIVIGRNARIGANAVVLKPVADDLTVTGIPAQPVAARGKTVEAFLPYGTPCTEGADPVANAIRCLMDEVETLRRRVRALEKDGDPDAPAPTSTEMTAREEGHKPAWEARPSWDTPHN